MSYFIYVPFKFMEKYEGLPSLFIALIAFIYYNKIYTPAIVKNKKLHSYD